MTYTKHPRPTVPTMWTRGIPKHNLLVDDLPWIINDIRIGNRSSYSLADTRIDSFVSFETAEVAMDVVTTVTFTGESKP
jgi:hypothetical protein